MILESGIINIYLLPNTLQSATVQFKPNWTTKPWLNSLNGSVRFKFKPFLMFQFQFWFSLGWSVQFGLTVRKHSLNGLIVYGCWLDFFNNRFNFKPNSDILGKIFKILKH